MSFNTERHDRVSIYQDKSKQELCELLHRQEKLLANKKFIQSLPDKGKKISDMVEKLQQEISRHEELPSKRDCLLVTIPDCQSQYHCADTPQPIPQSPRELSQNGTEQTLIQTLEKVTLSERKPRDGVTDAELAGAKLQMKPHYVQVLERSEEITSTRKPRFKPNQVLQKTDGSGSSTPTQSPGAVSQHNSQVQVLSLVESAALQREQSRKYEELQAMLAAEKMSEQLGISMSPYNPEGKMLDSYREVHDDRDSSDDD